MSTDTRPEPSQRTLRRIELLTPERYGEDFKLLHEFLAYKKCCCCIPNSAGETEAGWAKKREKWPADKLSLSAVAIDEATNRGRGICPLFRSWPSVRHAQVQGTRDLRGRGNGRQSLRRRGIGTQLMNWVDTVARVARRDDALSARLKGNPSRGLYERLGYVSKGQPGGALIACCCYGLFFGSCGAEMMF